MSLHVLVAVALVTAALLNPASAGARQLADAAPPPVDSSREREFELGAVVDVRRPNSGGLSVLAITPGGAADRLGLRSGDQIRALNGHRLDGASKPSSTLASALQAGNGALRVEAIRGGIPIVLSGRADIVDIAGRQGHASCGYVTTSAGVVPRSKGIFSAEITQIDGQSTPLQPRPRHRVKAGKHVLVVRELIDPNRLSSTQLFQISKMKSLSLARAYKSIVVDVGPGVSYRIGARLIKEKLDTQSIRDNAYWEPVVWEQVPEACP